MFRTEKREVANLRIGYATAADFCKAFESDMKTLYLLAFLLTANHKDAERCFVSTVDAAFKEQAVFSAWAQSWIRRSLIKNAIQIVSPASGRGTEKRELWSAQQPGTPADGEIDAVTRLAPLERFILVMSILERYSAWECSLLLGCSMKKVVQIRLRALHRLPGQDAFLARTETMFSRSFQATA
jgi:DNA-directed RNA polymerase specialized sigma24 family protein